MRKVGIILVVIGCLFSFHKTGTACEGARPMAMGGAFTGLADDANATYWNPAALGLFKKVELTYTGTVYDRDAFNYDDWVSVVVPLRPFAKYGNYGAFMNGTLGVSFMNNIDKGDYSLLYYGLPIGVETEVKHRWYMLSYGYELNNILEGLCLGVNLRGETHEETLELSTTLDEVTYAAQESDEDDCLGVDVGLYYLWNNLSMGVLFQDVNERDLTIFGVRGEYKVNIRPGIAYRFFDNRLIVSLEGYDIADNSDYRNLRFGAEANITDNISIRAGGYDITATEKTGRAVTGGIGISFPEIDSEYLPQDTALELNYGVIYWYASEADLEDQLTHLVNVVVKF